MEEGRGEMEGRSIITRRCIYIGRTHAGRVDHTFGSASSSRGVHDEQRMAEWQLLKPQLRTFVTFHKVFKHHTEVGPR